MNCNILLVNCIAYHFCFYLSAFIDKKINNINNNNKIICN